MFSARHRPNPSGRAPRGPISRATGWRRGKAADELLDLMGIGRFADLRVEQLSTGVRRVTELTCLIALRPTVLLLDEPSSGIAQAETEALAAMLRRVKASLRATLVVV